MLSRDLPLGCDARWASWEVYHPQFTARQLDYLQGCPVPLLLSRSLLSRGRLTGSSENECQDIEQEFHERCKQFRLRPSIPETLSTDIFGDWWEVYTQDFFGGSVDDIITKIFGDRLQKAVSPPSKERVQGIKLSLLIIAAAVAKKRLALSKRADPTVQTPPSKRPRQEAESTREAPYPHKRVKKLAKKGEREIHVISSQTSEATASGVLPTALVPQKLSAERRILVSRSSQVSPSLETVEPAAAPTIPEAVEPSAAASDGEPAAPVPHVAPVPEVAPLLVERQTLPRPKRTAIILEEV